MTRLHQHFDQALMPIEDGSILLDQLHSSLEAFNRDRDFLHNFEAGNTAQMGSFMALYAHQVPELKDVPNVGLEGVQVHVSSAQVEAVIAFLKKNFPKLTEMVKNLFFKFMDWVSAKISQFKIAAVRLSEKLRVLAHHSIELRPERPGDKAALAMLAGKIKPFDTYSITVFTGQASTLMAMLAGNPNVNKAADHYVEYAAEWLTCGYPDSVRTTRTSVKETIDGTYVYDLLHSMESPVTVAREAIDNLPAGLDHLTIRAKDAQAALERLQADAHAMVVKIGDIRSKMNKMLTEIRDLVNYRQDVTPEVLSQMKAGPVLMNQTVSIVSCGMRVRTQLLIRAAEVLSHHSDKGSLA